MESEEYSRNPNSGPLEYGEDAPEELKEIIDDLNGDKEETKEATQYKNIAQTLLKQFEAGNDMTDWEEVTKIDIEDSDQWEDVTDEP